MSLARVQFFSISLDGFAQFLRDTFSVGRAIRAEEVRR